MKTNNFLLRRIDKTQCALFKARCKKSGLTMTKAFRLFIKLVATDKLYFSKSNDELTIKDNQYKIGD